MMEKHVAAIAYYSLKIDVIKSIIKTLDKNSRSVEKLQLKIIELDLLSKKSRTRHQALPLAEATEENP